MRKNYYTADLYSRDFEGFIQLALRKVFEGIDARGYFRVCGIGIDDNDYDSSDGNSTNDDN